MALRNEDKLFAGEKTPATGGGSGPSRVDRLCPRGGLGSIDEILKRWLKDNRVSKLASGADLSVAWKLVVGDEIALHTRVADFSKGELLVEVDSASLLTELSTYFRQQILESLRHSQKFQGIQRVRFRSGSF